MNYHVDSLDASICVPPRAHSDFSHPQLYDTDRMGDRPLEYRLGQPTTSQEVHVDGQLLLVFCIVI